MSSVVDSMEIVDDSRRIVLGLGMYEREVTHG